MKRIYLSQVNNTYGKNAFLPYSVGLLQAYALTIPEIKDNYEFKGFLYLRQPIEDVVSNLDNPDVFGVSCYIWNWNYSINLAKAIRQAFPNCLIILGGPHVPVNSEGFLTKHPYVDLLVHYEGELTFADILLERLKDGDYDKIPGLTTKNGKTPPRPRIADLEAVPSPYLSGIFDELIKEPLDFHATQETHRGCPYSCTFCDWGSAVFSKVRKFSDERLIKELYWFADKKIDLLYNADANYALFERDIELIRKMVEIKTEYGFPKKFRAAYAKNSNDRVFTVAKMLNNAGMNKGVTLSFQSMDDNTLTIIKRKNIQVKDFKNLMQKYRKENIATYSELIIGLPGETYDSFANGLNTMLECGQHDSLQIYTCECLPNAEMNHPAYKTLHGIKTAITPVLFFHGTPSIDPYQEFYELVTETKTLPYEDWLKCQKLSWIIQCFHCLSLTQCIAVFLHNYNAISYRDFYEGLLHTNLPLLSEIINYITCLFEGIKAGKDWGIIDKRFGNIVWPPEEGGFLKIITKKDQFYEEIAEYISNYNLDLGLTKSIINYQKAIIMNPLQCDTNLSLIYNIHEYLQSAYLNEKIPLVKKPIKYLIKAKPYDSQETFAREVIWYGRKGGKFLNEVICSQEETVH